ncbi:MAG: delta-60 repeat domain-containing protein [Verrucomicrobiota bacterium]|nr:delta-60 repeat domain-containing protein [Verrucomicrobiota bacterium]
MDTSFDPGSGANSTVFAVTPQSDGKILIGGAYSQVNGIARSRIARLNIDGSVDMTFDPGSGTNSWVFSIATQTDGKVVIGGWFTQINGVTRNFIARLNANGSVDMSFDPGSGANQRVYAVAVQTDGKIVIGGVFTQIDGVARGNIARLNANGSLDTSFDPGTGANNEVRALAIQNDGKVVIAGSFNQVNGVTRANVARLDPNGSVDMSFDPGSGANSYVSALALQSDGKVVISGNFIQIDGMNRSHIGRLNPNGGVDTSFDPGTGANAIVYAVAVQASGKVGSGTVTVPLPQGRARGRVYPGQRSNARPYRPA